MFCPLVRICRILHYGSWILIMIHDSQWFCCFEFLTHSIRVACEIGSKLLNGNGVNVAVWGCRVRERGFQFSYWQVNQCITFCLCFLTYPPCRISTLPNHIIGNSIISDVCFRSGSCPRSCRLLCWVESEYFWMLSFVELLSREGSHCKITEQEGKKKHSEGQD